jgi:hypothetical protein
MPPPSRREAPVPDDEKVHGGSLRMFPLVRAHVVAAVTAAAALFVTHAHGKVS